MKLVYNGGSAVDIPGHDNVQPGDTVDVTDELGKALAFAGTQVCDDGSTIPPETPLWVPATTKKPAAAAQED